MPPNLRTMGAATFDDPQRTRLNSWLREAGWPRAHMNVAALEGYLVALIAWPVAVASGAWLPPIWGVRGWKVPTKIAARNQYEEFVGLIVGYMQDLDRRLSLQTARFESSVLRSPQDRVRAEALGDWGKGFMTALALDSQGLKWRSESTRAAVRAIANATSASAPSGPHAVEQVVSAVRSLIEQRTSRGPLGPVESVARPEAAIERTMPG